MREIDVNIIKKEIINICRNITTQYPCDVFNALKKAVEIEEGRSKQVIKMLIENADIAGKENIPICQDTGMVSVYLQIGQDVHLINDDLKESINKGVRIGYQTNYLRKSIVSDPLFDRNNTLDNTPALIYIDLINGDKVIMDVVTKGFGSENMSKIKMFRPTDSVLDIRDFIVSTVLDAKENACPPMIVGVGIGGSFDYAPYLSKKALLRSIEESNNDIRYKELEDEILKIINKSNIGPLGLKGKTTALKVQIEEAPTHIAGLPVAVSICCHASRHIRSII